MLKMSIFKVGISFGCAVLCLSLGMATMAADGWQYTGEMNEARLRDTPSVDTGAVVLPDGRVLITGGRISVPFQGTVARQQAEVFDLSTGTWSIAGSLLIPRWDHTATLLSDGRVLLVGGNTLDGYQEGHTASAEIFDPTTGTSVPTGSMSVARVNHTATRLLDGQILVSGGRSSNYNLLNSAELYDPVSGTFTTTGSESQLRSGGVATLLDDGRVLVTGGVVPYVTTNTAAVYDPTLGAWSAVGPMTAYRCYHEATKLPDGRVLLTGGSGVTGLTIHASAEVFDPTTDTFASVASMNESRAVHAAQRLDDGRVMVIGGYLPAYYIQRASTEIYDPETDTWTTVGSLNTARSHAYTAKLVDGRVLIAGGYQELENNIGLNFATAEIYGPIAPPDQDLDGIPDATDNCVHIPNPDQSDVDHDGAGDACDSDDDGDLILDALDNCPMSANPEQSDADLDNIGDVCDLDIDGDTIENAVDNCLIVPNPDQTDTDGDLIGDDCGLSFVWCGLGVRPHGLMRPG